MPFENVEYGLEQGARMHTPDTMAATVSRPSFCDMLTARTRVGRFDGAPFVDVQCGAPIAAGVAAGTTCQAPPSPRP